MDNSNLFLIVWRVGSPRSRHHIDYIDCSTFLFHNWSSHGRGGEGALWGLFYKNTNPADKAPLTSCKHPPKAPTSNTLGVRVSASECCRDTDIQIIAKANSPLPETCSTKLYFIHWKNKGFGEKRVFILASRNKFCLENKNLILKNW